MVDFYRYGRYGVQNCVSANEMNYEEFPADLPLVGSNPERTNDLCNVFSRNIGCLNGHKHVGKPIPPAFLGQKKLGEAVFSEHDAIVHISANHCSNPLCPLCCFGWAKRYAKRALGRFDVFDLVYGGLYDKVHVTVSVPRWDYDKSLKFLREQCLAFAGAVGVIGCLCIYHPKRKNKVNGTWFFAPHFHLVGYVLNGMVDGVAVAVVSHATGYVLKNLEKRKSVYYTVLYQLSHAGVAKGVHSITWAGELNYRNNMHGELKELLEANERDARMLADRKSLCPCCGDRMVHVCRVAKAERFDYEAVEEQFVVDKVINWVAVGDDVKFRGRHRKRKCAEDGVLDIDEREPSG